MRMTRWRVGLGFLALTLTCPFAHTALAQPAHGVAMHGEPTYPPDFTHFDYVDPNAPKGGSLVMAAIGSFDSLNPYHRQGHPGGRAGHRVRDADHRSRTTRRSASTASWPRRIDMPDDRSWVAFELRPQARWHDGQPVTVDDVIFSFETCSRPRASRSSGPTTPTSAQVEQDGERRVKFVFDGTEQPRAAADPGPDARCCRSTTGTAASSTGPRSSRRSAAAPTGSRAFDAGRGRSPTSASPDYWGDDIPVNSGRNNFDERPLRILPRPQRRAGGVQGRPVSTCGVENSSRFWATGYEGPALAQGPDHQAARSRPRAATGMQGFVFNTRRPKFAGPARARRRSAYAFDFEWTNKNAVLRPVRPHRELLLQLRAGGRRACRDPTSWRCSSRSATGLPKEVFDAGLRAARDRRLGQQPRQPAPGRGPAQGGRLRGPAAASWSMPRPASRWRSRSCSIRAGCSSGSSAPFVKDLERLGVAVHAAHRRRCAVRGRAWRTSTST